MQEVCSLLYLWLNNTLRITDYDYTVSVALMLTTWLYRDITYGVLAVLFDTTD